jgi:uncharacterized protein (TIGR00269 family)
MKCRKCGEKAIINMRQHKLALCKAHYLVWVPEQTQRFIEKYKMFTPDDRVLVAVSGGKDSLALWNVLLRLGYQADGLYIDLGIDYSSGESYSGESLEKVRGFVETFWPDAHLEVVDVKALYGAGIPEAARISHRGRGKPCSVCGLVKRHVMNRVTRDDGYVVLATGHNLDDEAAVLMSNVLHWQTGYLARQAPTLPASHPGLAKKVKPFCRFYERETAAYALALGIDYVYEECPHSVGSKTIYYKELLNQLERESSGTKLQFYLSFLRAKKKDGLFTHFKEQVALNTCERCSQPTSAPGTCAFCRLWDRIFQVRSLQTPTGQSRTVTLGPR